MENSESYSNEKSLEQFFNHYVLDTTNGSMDWYKDYKKTCQQIEADYEISDETLYLIWYQRGNSISSLMQGAPSKDEFEKAKPMLRELTKRIKYSPTAQTYLEAQGFMREAKEKKILKKNYKALLNRAFASIAPKVCTSTVDERYFIIAASYLNERFNLGLSMTGNWFELNQEFTTAISKVLPKDYDYFYSNIATWHTYEDLNENRLGDSVEEPMASNYGDNRSISDSHTALNQILYGPPGTGKTYHAIEAAVRAAEPSFYENLNIEAQVGATPEQREQLQFKFKELSDSERIRFVTFHQSFGYEEFVEGLSATSTDGEISYEVKSGIFKEICEQASRGVEQSNDPFEIALEKLKGDLEEGVKSLSLRTQRGNKFDVQYHGNTTFRAFPHESSHDDLGNGYPVAIDSIRKLYSGAEAKQIYNQSYVKAILKYIVETHNLPVEREAQPRDFKNFVLVIDEINRGNISKIFGELITLVEESKRSGKGQFEAIEVVLPYSGDKFSVPNNLHIIGTMNTADRSLAMMDTALRRRFDFKEMMPNPSLLAGKVVDGIDLQNLFEALNQRIEILYDREHTLGHAFFMGVQNFDDLVSVFQNKIIPLLAEYFFEDWEKIRLVLADNQKDNKENRALQFVTRKEQASDDLTKLFGRNHQLDGYGEAIIKYTLMEESAAVWKDPNAYKGIYQSISPKADANEQTYANAEDDS
ncbi:McrB family protein [Vibrio neonatus]|uniref:McrB family protein n=1 Tax=Vibrio neonatus TaxID=278860 RepID=UPI0021C26A9C|nr:AAA family ATPase [Vibrio neonatus]